MAKIKKDTSLRKAILQAAITGQLISNVEGETETGKQLLDKIIEERNKKLLAEWEENLKKNPKAKKPAPVVASEIDEDEIPFEIPESWCWCRLGEIMINRDSERIPLSVSQRELLEKNYDYYGASGVIDKVDKYLFDKDLLLIGEDGANLLTRSTPIAFIASGKYWVNNHAHVLDCDSNSINMNYIKFFINAISLAKYVTGTAQPKMNQEKMNSIPVALPPLSVQNAIVTKLEEVLPFVDAYENAVLEKEELKSTFSDKVKKAILQEAITGKLTESWRKNQRLLSEVEATQTGKQLLDRIIAERNSKALAEWQEKAKTNPKAKKPAAVVASEIDEDEIPFEIPDSWCWCRLGEVGDWKAGSTPSRSNPDFYKGNIPWLKTGDLNDGLITEIPEFVSEKALESCSMRLNPIGSILIAMYGATIGKLGILNIEATTNQACCACVPYKGIDNKFLFYYLMSQKKCFTEKAEGGAQPNISREKLVIHPFPLPPIAEQQKIVEILEQMLQLCEKLGG